MPIRKHAYNLSLCLLEAKGLNSDLAGFNLSLLDDIQFLHHGVNHSTFQMHERHSVKQVHIKLDIIDITMKCSTFVLTSPIGKGSSVQ